MKFLIILFYLFIGSIGVLGKTNLRGADEFKIGDPITIVPSLRGSELVKNRNTSVELR